MGNVIKFNKEFILTYENREIDLPKELKDKINIFWNDAISKNPKLFNGDDYVVENIEEQDDKLIFHVVKSNYAHYLYDERIGIKELRYKSNTPWAGILLLTNDDYFVLGEMGENTSVPGCLQIAGGGIDQKEIKDGRIQIADTIKRELREELNLNLDDIDYKVQYLEVPTETRNAYGFLAFGKIDKSKDELQKSFEQYNCYLIENNLEVEFSRLVFLKKDNAIEELRQLKNSIRPYMEDLIRNAMDGQRDWNLTI